MDSKNPGNFEEYVTGFPEETQKKLHQVSETIKIAVPEAGEKISYGMPTFTLAGKYLLYVAAYKNHIGIYPVPVGNKEFEKEFALYQTSGKGTIRFPLNKPMPLDLITRIVKYRVTERLAGSPR